MHVQILLLSLLSLCEQDKSEGNVAFSSAQTTKRLPPHRANDLPLNFLTLTSGQTRINLYAKFPCTDPKNDSHYPDLHFISC